MLNRIIIMGRLVRDPELRTTQSGVSVTSFTLAVDRDFKNRDSGEKSTDFIDVVAWRQTAEFICKYFGKGRMAVAEGRLQIRDWKDRDGNNRRSAEVVADNVYFADSKRDSAGGSDSYGAPPAYGAPAAPAYGGGQSYGGGYGAPAGDSSGFAEIDDQDGDLPF
ncbi:MAG: single-stranded DNA-binding protein [Oscillospiraceae bacterium]|jgi:single-strand DNA-binding protein|nr:single-stranded DNA-binding protein [Oscillospiraceae bacterium]MCI9391197.1 single-stranded DNA-binding protein [Oscillospiraceae bacterium]